MAVTLGSESVDLTGLLGVSDGDVDLARDRELVERCQSGDASAFDTLYRRYRRRLFRYCQQRLREPHEAEDVVQETFARAWRALPRFEGERRFYPWLTVIASHLCADTQRRRARCTPVEESRLSLADIGHYDVEDAVLHEVDSALVTSAFSSLSARHQRVLQLREGSGWSYQRIADHEGVPIGAVETLLWRARQALKREFAVLCGPEGRMGALIGSGVLFSRRAFRHLVQVPVRHVWSSTQGLFGGVGPLGSYAAPLAAATGAVALSVGAVMMLPIGSPAGSGTVIPALHSIVPSQAGSPSGVSSSGGRRVVRPDPQQSGLAGIVGTTPGSSTPSRAGSSSTPAGSSSGSGLAPIGTALSGIAAPSAPLLGAATNALGAMATALGPTTTALGPGLAAAGVSTVTSVTNGLGAVVQSSPVGGVSQLGALATRSLGGSGSTSSLGSLSKSAPLSSVSSTSTVLLGG